MKNQRQINKELRYYNRKNYYLLFLCLFLSELLITAYAVMMQSPTVLTILPEGGDSRKQVSMIFFLAVFGCGVFVVYAAALFLKYKSRETGILMALGASARQLGARLLRELLLVSGIISLGTSPYLLTMSATPVNVPPSLKGLRKSHSTILSSIGLLLVSMMPCRKRLAFSSWSKKKG